MCNCFSDTLGFYNILKEEVATKKPTPTNIQESGGKLMGLDMLLLDDKVGPFHSNIENISSVRLASLISICKADFFYGGDRFQV